MASLSLSIVPVSRAKLTNHFLPFSVEMSLATNSSFSSSVSIWSYLWELHPPHTNLPSWCLPTRTKVAYWSLLPRNRTGIYWIQISNSAFELKRLSICMLDYAYNISIKTDASSDDNIKN